MPVCRTRRRGSSRTRRAAGRAGSARARARSASRTCRATTAGTARPPFVPVPSAEPPSCAPTISAWAWPSRTPPRSRERFRGLALGRGDGRLEDSFLDTAVGDKARNENLVPGRDAAKEAIAPAEQDLAEATREEQQQKQHPHSGGQQLVLGRQEELHATQIHSTEDRARHRAHPADDDHCEQRKREFRRETVE